MSSKVRDEITYTLKAKDMEYFFISSIFFFIFVGCAGVSVFEIHSSELFRTQQQNKVHRFKNNHFGTFSVLDTG